MKSLVTKLIASAAVVLTLTGIAVSAFAAPAGGNNVALPDESAQTTLRAVVREQCNISVPSEIVFNVTDIARDTSAAGAVNIDKIVLASEKRQLKLSLRASAGEFSAPEAGAPTWKADAISWAADGWSRAKGQANKLSADEWRAVATSDAGVTQIGNEKLGFVLGANDQISRSGDYTLNVNWRVESVD
jgi:hypothetical protein